VIFEGPLFADDVCRVSDCKGHFTGRHELLLYGIELEHRKADCGEEPLWVFWRQPTFSETDLSN
jgi:hypothetical protein